MRSRLLSLVRQQPVALLALFEGRDGRSVNGSGGSDGAFLGNVYLTANTFPPPGTAFAAGQVLPISQYTALFALLGTTYGGDGQTNFRLPDLHRQAPGGLHYVIQMAGLFPSRP